MRLFTKTKKSEGWIAIALQSDGITVAHIKRQAAAKPVIDFLALYPSNQASVAASLEKLCKELQLSHYDCTNVLAAGEYQLLSVDAPNVPPDELKNAIRWRLKDMLDYRVEDATIDVIDVPAEKNGPVRNRSMYAVAARNQLIEQRQDLFGQAKIPLSVIDVPDMAQRNISALLEPEGRGVAMLSFDADGGLLTVTFAGELYLSRRIEVTSSQLQQSGSEQQTACFEKITLELQRSLDHFDRQYNFIALSKLILAPLSNDGSDLQAYLAANLYTPVETLNLDAVLDTSKVPELQKIDQQQRYFLTIGAALRHEKTAL